MRPYQKLQRYKTVWVLMGNSAVLCVVIIYRETLVNARTFVFIYSERVSLSSTQKLLLHCYRHLTRKPLVLWLIVPPQIHPIALSCPTSKFFVMPSFTVFKGQNGGGIVKSTTTKPDQLAGDNVLVKITASGVCGTGKPIGFICRRNI